MPSKRAGRRHSRQGNHQPAEKVKPAQEYHLGYFSSGPVAPSPIYSPLHSFDFPSVPYSPEHPPSAAPLFPHPPQLLSPIKSSPPLLPIDIPPLPDRRPPKPYEEGSQPQDPRPQPISARLTARLQDLFGSA
ncbi:uncharacterized protein LOC134534511 [Bacillus rossius redtenbacheri]|uniref:uncharacterized protein LOC134534511 n=1 Tax=Bacillus rossius redtenbacheri TaxID=93214 RepID=UPI002FDD82BA